MIDYYWDSCCFISRLQRDEERIRALEYITDEAAAGRVRIITSTVTIAEVCFLRARHETSADGEREQDAELIARFFDNPYIYAWQVTRAIAEEAARISRAFEVKPLDAIHLATAIATNTPVVHTYDSRKMLALNGKVGSPPLTIVTPDSVQRQPKLFDGNEGGTSASAAE
jgi:predicted nucleic acid-binding protein